MVNSSLNCWQHLAATLSSWQSNINTHLSHRMGCLKSLHVVKRLFIGTCPAASRPHPFPVKCFCFINSRNRAKVRTARPRVCTFFIRHHCLVTGVLLAWRIRLHGSVSLLKRPLPSQGGGRTREMDFTGRKRLIFQHELKRFHFGPIGNTGLSSHVIIFLFKESSIHAPAFFLVFVVTLCSLLHKIHCLKRLCYTGHCTASNIKEQILAKSIFLHRLV